MFIIIFIIFVFCFLSLFLSFRYNDIKALPQFYQNAEVCTEFLDVVQILYANERENQGAVWLTLLYPMCIRRMVYPTLPSNNLFIHQLLSQCIRITITRRRPTWLFILNINYPTLAYSLPIPPLTTPRTEPTHHAA